MLHGAVSLSIQLTGGCSTIAAQIAERVETTISEHDNDAVLTPSGARSNARRHDIATQRARRNASDAARNAVRYTEVTLPITAASFMRGQLRFNFEIEM